MSKSKLGDPPPELAVYQEYELMQELRRRRLIGVVTEKVWINGELRASERVRLTDKVEQMFLASKHQSPVTTQETLNEFWRRRKLEQHLQDLHDNPPPVFNMNFVPGLREAVDATYTKYCERNPNADAAELSKAYALICRKEAARLSGQPEPTDEPS